MQKIVVRKSGAEWILAICFYLLLLHDPLTRVASIFSYIDEGVAMLGVLFLLYEVFRSGKIVFRRSETKLVCAMVIFVAAGLLGNYLYRYQRTSAVVIDVVVNLKFFLSIITGYKLFTYCGVQKSGVVLVKHAKFSAAVLFVLLILDLVAGIFPAAGSRYGLRAEQLFFNHPTFLSSAAAFLLVVLTTYYERKNNLTILMVLITMFFTLRIKAIASVAVYILLYFFVLYQRKVFKIKHFLMIAAVAAIVAMDQFSYYYIEHIEASARAALTLTSVKIAKDYFPVGTGFGTFASNAAAEYYSPVYYMYGLSNIWGLAEGQTLFGSDTFWPIIIGQTGLIGTISYVYVLVMLFQRVLKSRFKSISAYTAGVFIFAYMLVSSTSEAAFCNAISIPLAVMLGYVFALEKHIDA